MSNFEFIATSSIQNLLEREAAAISIVELIVGVIIIAFTLIMLLIGATFVYGRLERKRERFIIAWGTALIIAASIVVVLLLLIRIDVQTPDWEFKTELETAVSSELSARYRFQDVEIAPQTNEAGASDGIRSWAYSLANDALEPARVLLRLEEGPTVPYELRLVGDTVELYPLHGDTTVPDPQQLRRKKQ